MLNRIIFVICENQFLNGMLRESVPLWIEKSAKSYSFCTLNCHCSFIMSSFEVVPPQHLQVHYIFVVKYASSKNVKT